MNRNEALLKLCDIIEDTCMCATCHNSYRRNECSPTCDMIAELNKIRECFETENGFRVDLNTGVDNDET